MSGNKWVVLSLLLLCALTCGLLLPCAQKTSDSPGWKQSSYSLRQIGQALLNYHKMKGKLPPAVVYDKNGKPLYSWRVLLLPFLDQSDLYRKFKLDEPWDSPHNVDVALQEEATRCYEPILGGMDPTGLTRFQVLVGPGTAFERPGLSLHDFPDGPEKTILAVEAAVPVPWSKPADLVYDPNSPLPPMQSQFTYPVRLLCYEVYRKAGFNAVFADGNTAFIRSDTDEKTLRALITRNGGEKLTFSDRE
jgi:Protein of unknown function (DUF1559)